MAGGEEGGLSFASTPSWIIAAVVFAIVGISLAIEKLLHYLGTVLTKKDKKPLYDALQKIKEELMLMGFVSLLLAVFQDNIANVCIPEKLAKKYWLPCRDDESDTANTNAHFQIFSRRRRLLASDSSPPSCATGKAPFVSLNVLHDLHYLIFVLAVAHIINCTLTVLLGESKISQWRKWEESIRSQGAEIENDREDKVIDIRTLSFIRDRFEGVDAKKRNYLFSFFKHLTGRVTKADYAAMRLGFVLAHCNGNQRFNFHRYMVYAYEADFQKVVSISWFLWLMTIIALSLNVAGWHIYFWTSLIPLILLLVVGTKLEHVITELAVYVAQRHTVVVGDIRIQPSDEYFWFKQPKVVLTIIHTILFLNSFGFAIFFWTLIKFDFHSCVMGTQIFVIARIVIMVVVQAICSYSTLPLYAIVTQMGTSYNKEAMMRYGIGSSPSAVHERSAAASVQMTSQ